MLVLTFVELILYSCASLKCSKKIWHRVLCKLLLLEVLIYSLQGIQTWDVLKWPKYGTTDMFCKKADRLFLSRQACIDLGMISPYFYYPTSRITSSREMCVIQYSNSDRASPVKPDSFPFEPTPKNVNKLKCFLVCKFDESALSELFLQLSTPRATCI